MTDSRAARRLAAILAADVVGYSRLMENDEQGTLAALKARRKDVLQPIVREHNGRVFKVSGDGVLVEFASPTDAVECAIRLQGAMAAKNRDGTPAPEIVLRVGINLGDVLVEGSDLYGDGVNIAARLEGLAEPGGICISRSVLDQVRKKLDCGFDELGKQSLKNIAEPVEVYRVQPQPKPAVRLESSPPRARPSIAVLPFDNLSGDPGQQYLSDGITEDIITELSRFRSLSVLGRHASFHLAGKGGNPVQAAHELGANFVVEGSVRKAGEQLRITAQLLDAETGNHVWADRYDRASSDVFAVQDEVVGAIVATLEGRMVAAAAGHVRKRPTSSWTAYDFFLKGRELSDAGLEREATPYFAEATRIDPDFALAHAWLGMTLLCTYWFDADEKTLAAAERSGQRALELDSNDPSVHHANAMVMLWCRRPERAALHFDRAISLNPMDTQVRADRSNLLRYTGRLEDALALIDEELRRSPYPPLWFWRVRGGILFDLKRYGEAIEAFGNMPQKNNLAFVQLAAAHGHVGDLAAARQVLAEARALRPSLSLGEVATVAPHVLQEPVEHLLEGLRKAGLSS